MANGIFAGEGMDGQQEASLPWKLTVVVSAIVCCLADAGLAFGFSALVPVLLRHGAFHDDCPEALLPRAVCKQQLSSLTRIFTTSTSLLNIAAMPSGAILDRFGPRVTATIFSALVGVGCALFAAGGEGVWKHAYSAGFLILAVCGPCTFNCTLSFGNLFPAHSGLITATLVGCFDASSVVFAGLAAAINVGASFSATFQLYAALPLLISVIAAIVWPKETVPAKASETGIGNGDSEAQQTLSEQIMTAEFGLFVYTVSTTMVCINFFIATVYEQLLPVAAHDAEALNRVFGFVLPLGGIVYIPVIGLILDRIGPAGGYFVLIGAYALFSLLMAAFAQSGLRATAYLAFAVFAFCRPLFYSLNASFCGQQFGFATFGKIFGLVTTISGFANLLVQPLEGLARDYGYASVRGALLFAQMLTAALPTLVTSRQRRESRALRTSTSICEGDTAGLQDSLLGGEVMRAVVRVRSFESLG